jgi:hypothetical protein
MDDNIHELTCETIHIGGHRMKGVLCRPPRGLTGKNTFNMTALAISCKHWQTQQDEKKVNEMVD